MVIERAHLRRAFALLTALFVATVASAAAACPVCASREEAGQLRWVALGAFIVTPWIVAGAVALYIRRGLLAEQGDPGRLPTEIIE